MKQALKDAEAARAIQSSASQANSEIQKADQAAKLSYFKHTPGFAPTFSAPWNVHSYAPKPIAHGYNAY